jgi:hypothetical protein
VGLSAFSYNDAANAAVIKGGTILPMRLSTIVALWLYFFAGKVSQLGHLQLVLTTSRIKPHQG